MSEKYWDEKIEELNEWITRYNTGDVWLNDKEALRILKQIAADQREACRSKVQACSTCEYKQYEICREAIRNAEIKGE